MGNFGKLPLVLFTLSVLSTISTAQDFKCRSPATCQALVGYAPVNRSSISDIQSLFNVKNLRSILGANDLPLNTPRNFTVEAKQVVKVPIPCLCTNNTGVSNKKPTYIVKKDDGLYFIARTDLIQIGQNLTIPLPCSCDDVENQKVVHYAHVVEAGSSFGLIAKQFGTDARTLMDLNGINDSMLIAGEPVDVPLKACNSSIRSDSLDNSLLVANGTYAVTADSCVKCSCDSANNTTLQCEPSQILRPHKAKWDTCPAMQCESESLSLGNTTSNGCSQCTYAGYNETSILTSLKTLSTCSTPSNNASKMGSNWNFLLISIFILFLNM
ncbi:LysM domain-containing GPI-anchored protein like [Melia azedarach]|uniref:LysM domain-containing GPI-anchored protein like n=1 Tax=Melia azedarach TaxID=155640 RepID=A0ACC1XWR7_MELAZ|nr:LysM domain-containing GPI-anchored protein like [Melia azedarach]